VDTLVHLMRHGSNERVPGTAAQVLLDRGWGKPKVEVVADGGGSCIEALRLFNEQIAAVAGALYYPQAGIINPTELAPIASIYLAVWVAIGGRGRIYGAVIGAAFVSLVSSYFTGGQAPNIPLGFADIIWTDWWLVLLGVSFVVVTIYAPQGLGGLVDRLAPQRKN
jgi:hypothetical protein